MFAGVLPHDSYFYPRSPCGERRQLDTRGFQFVHISIHALLAESDVCHSLNLPSKPIISIHALLAESDFTFLLPLVLISPFLSTLSLRRATKNQPDKSNKLAISIHALLAESDRKITITVDEGTFISIHALLAESDGIGLVFLWWGVRFLSTLSLRRATILSRYQL